MIHTKKISTTDDIVLVQRANFACDISESGLINKSFIFSRSDGTVITQHLTLGAAGSIERHRHPDEDTWLLQADGLVFVNESGNPTTVFDKVKIQDGRLVFLGKYLREDPTQYWHCLTEHGRPTIAAPAPFVKRDPILNNGDADVAVLVRAHKVDEKFLDLMGKLNTGRKGFDLYPIMDETRGRPEVHFEPVIWHSVESCRRLGLSQPKQALLWHCGDFPLYHALRELPDYKYYIMIEYDVDLVNPDASFFNEIASRLRQPDWRTLDFAALEFYKMTPKTGWYEACAKFFPDKYCHFAYFPLILLSKRVACHLFAQRQLEALRDTPDVDVIHCEAFVASCAVAGGFHCADFRQFMPGSYVLPLAAMQIGSFGGLGKPMGVRLEIPEGVEIIHPIYSHGEFLDRAYRKYVIDGKGDWNRFAATLDGPDGALIPEAIKLEWRARIAEAGLARVTDGQTTAVFRSI